MRAGIAGLAALFLLGTASGGAQLPLRSSRPATAGHAADAKPSIDAYIQDAWTTLRRSMLDCATLRDPKVKTEPVLYLPQDFAEPAEVAAFPALGDDLAPVAIRSEGLGSWLGVAPRHVTGL